MLRPRSSTSRSRNSLARLAVESLEARDVPAAYSWLPTEPGAYSWNDPANWDGNEPNGFPNAAGDVADLTAAITGNQVVTLGSDITVGVLNFGSAGAGVGAFTIAGNGNTLTFEDASGTATLTATAASDGDAILADIAFATPLTITNSTAAPLSLFGNVTGNGTITVNGTGPVAFPLGVDLAAGVTLAGSGTITTPTVLYAISFFDSALYAFDSQTGDTLATISAPYGAGNLLGSPAGLTIGPDGNLYIGNQASTANPNESILKYDLNTLTLSTFITKAEMDAARLGTGNTNPVFAPSGVAFGPDGDLYVVLTGGQQPTGPGSVIRFDVAGGAYAGTFTEVLGGLSQPAGLTFGPGTEAASLYVSHSDPVIFGGQVVGFLGRVTRVEDAPTTPTPSTFIAPGSGNLSFASGLVFGPTGDLYVADLAALEEFVPTSPKGRIVRFNPDGSNPTDFTPTAGNPGSLSLQFPAGVVFDDAGRLLVGALGPTRPPTTAGGVYRYLANGTFDGEIVSSAQFPNTGTTQGGQQTSGVTTSRIALGTVSEVALAGSLAPGGAAPGILTVGNLDFAAGSTFAVDLDGITAGTGYDRLVATGTLALNNTVLNLDVGFAVPVGTAFTIITANAPVVGTFAGLPEGTSFSVGGQFFQITYHGGAGGNDVVLTRMDASAPAFTSAAATTFFTGRNNTFAVAATGVPSPTFSVTGGTLPNGVTLSPAGLLSGTPTATGNFLFTITATNGNAPDAVQNFNLTVNPGVAASITSTNAATFVGGTGGTFTVTASGTPTPTLAQTAALPSGTSFNAATGVLTVGPTTPAGIYSLNFTATNGVGATANQTFTLTVGRVPSFTSATSATFTTGLNGSFTVAANGVPNPTLSVTGTLPTGVTFNPATGLLSGSAAAGVAGTYPLSFTATNGIGAPVNQNFTLTVTEGAAPSFTSADATQFVVGTAGTFQVTATGNPVPTFSLTSGTLPTGLSFDAGAGQFVGTPAAGSAGTYPLSIRAVNALGDTTQNFTLTVASAPAITSANSATFLAGAAVNFTVIATGVPAPTFTATGLPAGVTLDPNTGVLSGSSATVAVSAVTITASNGIAPNATQNFTLTIGNVPTITSAGDVTFIAGTGGTFTVTAVGTPTPTLDQTAALPTGVTFNAATGVLTVDATTVTGDTTLTFTATNVLGTNTQTFTLSIVDPPPTAPPLPARLAVSGLPNGAASVFDPNAAGQYPITPTATPNPFAGLGVLVRTAVGDVNNDGFNDTIFVTGPGTPIRFAVVSGANNTTLLIPPTSPFAGSESFTGGGFVAAMDIDGDGRAEIVVTPDQGGGPRVTIFSLVGTTPTVRANFLGIDDPNFRGGARAALGDVNGDTVPDLAVAAGFLGGPRIAVFDGTTLFNTPTRLVNDFFAFPGTDAVNLRNGAYVAVGDVNGDDFADLIFGGGPGGAPRVFVLSGALVSAGNIQAAYDAPIANFFVTGNANDRGGVRVTAVDADGDGRADIAVGSGMNLPANVRIYLGANFTTAAEPEAQDLAVFNSAVLADGVYVG